MESWQKPRLRYTKRVEEIYQHVKMISVGGGCYEITDYRDLSWQEHFAIHKYLDDIGYDLSLIDWNRDRLFYHVAKPKGELPPPVDTLMGRLYAKRSPFETVDRIKRTQINNADCLVFKTNDDKSNFNVGFCLGALMVLILICFLL